MKKKLYAIEIIEERIVNVTSEADPDDDYSSDSTFCHHDIKGFKVVDSSKFNHLLVDFEPVINEDYYLLYAVYSTGDSFGCDDSSGIEYFGLYKQDQLATADKNLESIKKSADNGQMTLTGIDGQTVQLQCPWGAIFEVFEWAEIKKVQLILES